MAYTSNRVCEIAQLLFEQSRSSNCQHVDVEDGDAPDIILSDVEHEGDKFGGGTVNRRTNVTEELRLKSVRRPAHALFNSRA